MSPKGRGQRQQTRDSASTWHAFTARLFDQNKFAIKLGLDNIRRAFELEDHPERAAPAIIVGGTNGKGSVASAIAAMLQAHRPEGTRAETTGLRVGLFTSPHLIEFRERIRIDGRPVSRDVVLEHGAVVMQRYAGEDAAEATEPLLTFFELTTVIAARIFKQAAVDVVVWEVGLGGRLDAINAIEPALTVITNIGIDHEAYLGTTIAQIAAEKGALRRADVPFVLAPQTHAEVVELLGEGALLVATADAEDENWATATTAATAFLGAKADPALLDAARTRWRWPGRADRRRVGEVDFVLDAAHNPAGAERLMALLDREPVDGVVVAAMSDKALAPMFAGVRERELPAIVVQLATPRAATLSTLHEVLGERVVHATDDPAAAFDVAAQRWRRVAVFGSIYLLGEWFAWAGYSPDDLVTYSV